MCVHGIGAVARAGGAPTFSGRGGRPRCGEGGVGGDARACVRGAAPRPAAAARRAMAAAGAAIAAGAGARRAVAGGSDKEQIALARCARVGDSAASSVKYSLSPLL